VIIEEESIRKHLYKSPTVQILVSLINLLTKFEISILTHYEDRKGDA